MNAGTPLLAVLAAGCLVSACNLGSDDDDGGGSGGTGNMGADPPASGGEVTVSGTVTFDFVPSRPQSGQGLAYEETEPRPVRAATVEAVADGQVLAAATTDETGAYALDVPAGRTAFLRVRAEMTRTGGPAWDVRVVDNTDGNAPYALDGTPFGTGDADQTRDLHAASGWTGSSYGGVRAAAPFAILDTVYDAMQVVLAVEPALTFPPLLVHWSPENRPTSGNIAVGDIGSSFYRSATGSSPGGIYILGAENSDTDEYDRHVVAHEWGHYFEDRFSRSDSIGGRHALGDRLDMRAAFGEGFGNAFSGMVTGSPLYVDAAGEQQSQAFGFDMEGGFPSNSAPGWYSEQSVHEMLWDLYDSRNVEDVGHADSLTLGFAPLYAVLTVPQAATPALTSVFSFVDALKAQVPDAAPGIDALTNAQNIEAVPDAYGTTEDDDAGTENGNVLPVYMDLSVNGGPVAGVCSTNEFKSERTGARNKLGSRRFLKFEVADAGRHTIAVTTTEMPAGEHADPDFIVHQAGEVGRSDGPPSPACKLAADAAECTETGVLQQLAAGPHVLEVYEWTNTNDSDDGEYPPIGRTCFDVEVTRP